MKTKKFLSAIVSLCVIGGLMGCGLSAITKMETKEVIASTGTPTVISPQPTASKNVKPTISNTATPSEESHLISIPMKASLNDIGVDSNGILWISTSAGAFRQEGDDWQQMSKEPTGDILGVDGAGRMWILLGEGERIATFDGKEWIIYGEAEGWLALGEDYLSPGVGDGLSTDEKGTTWIATGMDDLRRFDPTTSTWELFKAIEIGFDAPTEDNYQGHFLTDTLLASDGSIWVSDCIGMGENLEGQGARRFDGTRWEAVEETKDMCIFDMEMDDNGRIWLGTFDIVIFYDAKKSDWSILTLPVYERRQFVTKIDLDVNGIPWIEVLRAGGASLFGSTLRLHLAKDQWIIDDEQTNDYMPSSLALSKSGESWICKEGGIFRMKDGVTDLIFEHHYPMCKLQIDGQGKIWAGFLAMEDSKLWKY